MFKTPEIHEFFIEGGKKSNTHVLLHITEPTTPSEVVKGYFFALIHTEGAKSEHITFIQDTIDDIEAQYYSDADTSFEEILEATNRRTRKLITHIPTLECVIGVLQGEKLFISYRGKPYATLFYQKQGSLHPLSIIGSEETEETTTMFSSLLEGTIGPDDTFFVATHHVKELFSEERIQTLLASEPHKQTASYIEQVLKQTGGGRSYGGIFFSLTKHKKEQHHPPAPTMTTIYPTSSKQPISTELRTDTHTPYQTERNKTESIWSIIGIAIGKAIIQLSIHGYNALKTIVKRGGKIFVGTIVFITNHGNNRQTVIAATKQWGEDKKQAIIHLPLLTKILFFFTVCCAILFIGSIGYLRTKESKQQEIQAYAAQKETIINKKDAADAAIIYGDDDKALALLTEAKLLISSLSTEQPTSYEDKQTLLQDIEKSLASLQKMTVVTPTLIADIGQSAPNATITYLGRLGDVLIAYGPEDTSLYTVQTVTQSIETIPHTTIPNIQTGTTPKEDDATVFIYNNKELALFQKQTQAVTTADIAYPTRADGKEPIISALSIYNQRLYTVDTANNTIYRHTKTQTGYDKGSVWLQGTTDISRATAIAIDGDVYVAEKHTIKKFTAGQEQPFTISGLDPALDAPIALWTYTDIPYLYLLEPTHKRVIILNKEGKLIAQYTANEWINPTGFVVDEPQKRIYILDNQKIYSIPITL